MAEFRTFSLAEAARDAAAIQNIRNNALALSAAQDRQRKLSPLMEAAAAGDQSAVKDVLAIDPELGNQVINAVSKMNEEQRTQFKETVETTARNLQAVMNAPDLYKDQAWQIVREDMAKRLGPDSIADMPEKYDPNWAQLNIDKGMSVSDLISARGSMFQPVPVYKDGKLVYMQASNVPGKTPTILDGITPVDKVDTALDIARGKAEIETDQAAATAEAKSETERFQESIQLGLDAAQGLPVINRSLELLNTIKTGGIDNARLAIKQAFGVEGADEGELSNNLGKAVLSQLRATFGAQFTEREGERLNNIEAGFGKSPETNKRLLGQLKKMAEDQAKRAIRRAKASGDMETAQEIEDLMNFKLANEEAPDEKPKKQTTAPSNDLTKLSNDDLLNF